MVPTILFFAPLLLISLIAAIAIIWWLVRDRAARREDRSLRAQKIEALRKKARK